MDTAEHLAPQLITLSTVCASKNQLVGQKPPKLSLDLLAKNILLPISVPNTFLGNWLPSASYKSLSHHDGQQDHSSASPTAQPKLH